MKFTKNTFGALLLIAFGVLIIIGQFGWLMGNILGWIIPIALIALGYYGVKRGRGFIGWVLMIVGIMILMSKLSGVIGWIIAIGMILYGINMLKAKSAA
ncbi:LiaF transmembrane domain-containing protein [Marinicrinis lubricantis]|uniref:LiaF transmembrane domain-containing protein n=1 Tax=Marinicrinis lubricantis TaxID=2086470 RepID=A0ABW1IJ98_9BACL